VNVLSVFSLDLQQSSRQTKFPQVLRKYQVAWVLPETLNYALDLLSLLALALGQLATAETLLFSSLLADA
jgi:hypothetical protein